MTLLRDLEQRGLLEQHSDPEIARLLAETRVSAYCGFDPTASSLHVGSLLPITMLMRLQRAGHKPVALVGGATGMIGDPSGKSQERSLLSPEQIDENVAGVRTQLERFLDFSGPSAARMVNNGDWFAGIGFIDFLRDVGKHFSVNAMIAKESVRARLTEREQGISYTEFSYMLIQAYDFLHLFDEGCTFQFGGSDQWGNITAGIDLIRRKRGQSAYGFTMPLITGSDGKKFGKTEGGNVWLDAARSSPYQFFQFFLNADDRDVGRYLKFFSFRPFAEIEEILTRGQAQPEKREAQRELARELTARVHGHEEAERAERATSALFGPKVGAGADVQGALDAAVASGAPSSTLPGGDLAGEGMLLAALLSRDGVKLSPSLSGARRDIAGGGIYLNEQRVAEEGRRVTAADLVDGKLLLRKGKKSYHIVRVEG